ncbi:MAG: OsmC family protein [Verrucomicrobiae bacterium]|nr:OsmC family protein [Verrucomicrobiae bacterium]
MNTDTQTDTTNGINSKAQNQINEALKHNPAMAQITFQASNEWKGGTSSRSRISRFSMAGGSHPHKQAFEVDTDLPMPFLGSDRAPTPAEYALHALAACMNSTMVYNCSARGITVRSSAAEIEGDLDARGFVRLDDSIRAGYQTIRIHFKVDADAPREVIEDLLKGSPMFDVFSRSVPIQLELETSL